MRSVLRFGQGTNPRLPQSSFLKPKGLGSRPASLRIAPFCSQLRQALECLLLLEYSPGNGEARKQLGALQSQLGMAEPKCVLKSYGHLGSNR